MPNPPVMTVDVYIGSLVLRDLSRRVDRFLLHTGLKRPELIELLFQNLSEAERAQDVQQSFYINNVNNPGPIIVGPALQPSLRVTTITADPADVHEEFQNLSNQKLDRIHRFVRLARALGWSFADLDWVLRSLGKLRERAPLDDRAVVPLLLKGLADQDAEVRVVAATYLGIIEADDPGVVPALIETLNDEDAEVRAAAATALGSFPDQAKTILPALKKARNDSDEAVAREAGLSIVKLQSNSPR